MKPVRDLLLEYKAEVVEEEEVLDEDMDVSNASIMVFILVWNMKIIRKK